VVGKYLLKRKIAKAGKLVETKEHVQVSKGE